MVFLCCFFPCYPSIARDNQNGTVAGYSGQYFFAGKNFFRRTGSYIAGKDGTFREEVER